MEIDLKGKVAIVTGAGRGIGREIAETLGREGAVTVVTDVRPELLDDIADTFGREGWSGRQFICDVRDRARTQAVVGEVVKAFGRVDVLVNNAGVGTAVPATRETPDQFREVIDVNLNGCYWMAQACGRVMQPGSSIVNISSVLGLTTAGLPQAAYSASKAALIGLTRDLAQQWSGRKGIRVNALAPGFFASEMTAQYPDGYLDSMGARIPLGRKGDARELAAALVFLASDAGGYVTGQTLAVDGGMTIT